jgi:hypothetical protein
MSRALTLSLTLAVALLFAAGEARSQDCESPEGCAAPASCPSSPTLGCSVSAAGSLSIEKHAAPAKSRLAWAIGWGNGAPTQSSFGDPTTTTSYSLCVYDGDALKLEANVEPSATLWTRAGSTGYRYENPSPKEGITAIKEQSGPDAAVAISVKGRGESLALPDAAVAGASYFDPANRVTVQWRVQGGACWSTTFAPANVLTNDGETYSAKF